VIALGDIAHHENHVKGGSHMFDMRPILADLWRRHYFNVITVSRATGISEDTIYAMLSYKPVEAASAEKVLAHLRALYQREYRLQTVRVKLLTGVMEWTRVTSAPYRSSSQIQLVGEASFPIKSTVSGSQ